MYYFTTRNDKCFKCIFLNPNNVDLLNVLIKSVTMNSCTNISFSNIERNISMAIRRKYLDALIDSNEAIIGIEVNGFNKKYVRPRNTAFMCDLYSNYTLTYHEYKEEKIIMQINFSYGIHSKEPIRKFMIKNKHNKPYVKNFIIYEINMDYCLKFWYDRHKKNVNEYIKKYRYFIMQALTIKELEELFLITQDERIEKYMNELKKVNSTPEFREYITEEQDKEFILNTVRKEERQIGLNEGKVIGLNEGKAIGQSEEKIEIARNMLNDNVNADFISKYTGLSINQINSIRF